MRLQLLKPKYNVTAAYCHFGREPYEKDGMKFFSWENAKDLSKYASMTADQVEEALKGSDYLTKWVDFDAVDIIRKCGRRGGLSPCEGGAVVGPLRPRCDRTCTVCA